MARKREKVHVWVEYEHIKKGTPRKSSSCPIALAIREKFNLSSRDISVTRDQITFLLGFPNDIAVPLTLAQEKWVDKFDDGFAVEPIRISVPLNKTLKSLLESTEGE